MISNKEAYLTLFKLLPLVEQKAVYEMISELLEDIEDAIMVKERQNEPTEDYMVFRQRLIDEGKLHV
jgi:hypothetical protein